jgi:MFS family permease
MWGFESSIPSHAAHSSSGPGRRPLKAEIRGSNPLCATSNALGGRYRRPLRCCSGSHSRCVRPPNEGDVSMVRSATQPAAPQLKTNARFRRFWLGRLLANSAQNAILLALLLTVVNRTGSTIHSSLLILSFIVPATLLGIVGGVVVDHLPKRPVLVLACLLRAVLCLAFLRSSESVWIIYATNLALSAITQFSGPAESALVPSLVGSEQIASATAMLNVGVILAQVIGSVALAPIFVKTVGVDPLFFVTLTLFLCAAIAYAIMPGATRGLEEFERKPRRQEFHGLRGSAIESWRLLRSDRPVFLAGVQQTLVTTTLVVLISVLPNYTKKVLDLPAENAVYIFAPAAIGVALGNWLVPRLVRGRGTALLAGTGFLVFLFSLTALGLGEPVARLMRQHALLGPLGGISPDLFYSSAVFSALVAAPLGFGYAIVLVAARLITYEHVPGHMQGRIFAFQGMLTSIASIVPLLVVGLLTALLGPRIVLLVIVAADLLALIYARSTLPRERTRRSTAVVALPQSRARR